LKYIDGKLGLTKSNETFALQKSPSKDKALAAAIAVSLALEEGTIKIDRS
tara:strand:+ start:653 stop:802 length:150 start_codon:yes stop_codon:yes gene_type:complete